LYSNDVSLFAETLNEKLSTYKPEYILYRDKESGVYDSQAKEFVATCSLFENTKSFIHQKVDLAKEIGSNGVHLTSLQFSEIEYAKSLGLEVIISTHSHEEVLLAQALGAYAVTYSPVFFSPDKGEPKGTDDLKSIVKKADIKIFALGGIIEDEQVSRVKEAAPYGFASIRYFF